MRRWAMAVALGLGAGCYAGLDGSGSGADESSGTSEDDGGGAQGEGETGQTDGSECGTPGSPVLRFLTRDEYRNTVRDLLGDVGEVTSAFPSDEAAAGFAANSLHAPSSTQVEMFFAVAQDLAEVAVVDRLDRFVDCQPSAPGCAQEFIESFGRRAFRRPLTEAEISEYLSDFDAIAAEQGAELGLQVVAAAMLASPNFLYIRHDDLASRLSYFLWSTMPDEELFDGSDSGALDSREGVKEQARRMLADPRAANMLASFSTQWLEVDRTETAKDQGLFPQWTPQLAEAARTETAELVRYVVLEDDARLSTLLLTPRAFVDDALAALYGVERSGSVDLPVDERAGVLTRAAFLSHHAHAAENSWVHRGKVIRERVLCGELPAPPEVADDAPLNDGARLDDARCSGCHLLMDPIGIGFEGYDPIGRFVAASAPGQVAGFEDPDFDGAIDLSIKLAESETVHACFVRQLFAYAHRRNIESEDDCALDATVEAFSSSDGDIAELVVALATSDSFMRAQQ